MAEEVVKSIGIKLNITAEQELELKQLFEAFRVGINWSLKEIEKRYQTFLKEYIELPDEERIEGICATCLKELKLVYKNKTGLKICMSCARRGYSEYTVRKEIYGARGREVESDLKEVTEIPNKTHYDALFGQAYSMWKSYRGWCDKRQREKESVEADIAAFSPELRHAVDEIEQNAKQIKEANKKSTWLQAKAQAFKIVYSIHQGISQEAIVKAHDKWLELRRLSRPIHFPELDECRTVAMNAGFVHWDAGKLYMTLFHKGQKEFSYWGKEYLSQFIPKMEQDNKAYCNLTKKGGSYYLMYPLTLKVRQPPDIKECDTFVFITSPTRTGIIGYDRDGTLQSVKWFRTGPLAFAKRHFKEKRSEIGSRDAGEKMRKVRRRKKKIHRMGNVEARFVSTYNHQLTREIVDYVMEQSENPKILIWDVGNGITQNFGRSLNYLKNLWPAVQQQEYLKHKAMQVSIPVVDIKYNTCNDLTCSSCEAKQMNEGNGKKKPLKVITQLIKGIKNFKCQKCGYEVNTLINHANNIAGL